MERITYLDTHVVVWLAAGQVELLSPRARQLVEADTLRISPMVLLELQYLYEVGKVGAPGAAVLERVAPALGLRVCEERFFTVAREAALHTWTRDPFDRIIVAQAGPHCLLTKDRLIREHCPSAVWD